jgi:hypothetical protein
MPLMTPAGSQRPPQAIELVHLTPRYENVLHDGGEWQKSQSIVPSLAPARREGKERRKLIVWWGLIAVPVNYAIRFSGPVTAHTARLSGHGPASAT